MLRIAVCDDSLAFRESAREMIERWSNESGVPVDLHLCADGDGLLSLCAGERIDLVFLDILMPLLNGLDTARELRARDTAVRIVFLTSSPEFALESYDVRAQGYLLKPADEKKVWAVLAEAATVACPSPWSVVSTAEPVRQPPAPARQPVSAVPATSVLVGPVPAAVVPVCAILGFEATRAVLRRPAGDE